MRDVKAAAAGDDIDGPVPVECRPVRRPGDEPAKPDAFEGRDDGRLEPEFRALIGGMAPQDARTVRGKVLDRMNRGELSSAAAMRLLQAVDLRVDEVNAAPEDVT
jgi:hypothetical protein